MSLFGKYHLSKEEIDKQVPVDERGQWVLFDEWYDPFEHRNGPILCKHVGDVKDPQNSSPFIFGFRSRKEQSNVAGVVHGGWLLSVADISMANAALHLHLLDQPPAVQGIPSLCTISLNMEFADRAECDAWIECIPEVYKRTKSHLFVRCLGRSQGKTIFAASASYRTFVIKGKL